MSGAKVDVLSGERICDATLRFEILSYQAMSKTEHSQHTRDVMAALIELAEHRAALAATKPQGSAGNEGGGGVSAWEVWPFGGYPYRVSRLAYANALGSRYVLARGRTGVLRFFTRKHAQRHADKLNAEQSK